MPLLKLLDIFPVDVEVDGRAIFRVGGLQVRAYGADFAVVGVEDGLLEQEAEGGHFGDEDVAGAVELSSTRVCNGKVGTVDTEWDEIR